jgi:serine phosphatase RsbU (regulator of sigma subunit)/pSer/pThr/pTyr-binding forkhead associated (FHA) protein
MAILLALQGPSPGQIISLDGPASVLGRHPGCDIVLESGSVSRQHARITNFEGNYYIEDLHSRNGTFVNGRLLTGRQLLKENDEIGICELSFDFHLNPPIPSDAPSASSKTQAGQGATIVDDEEVSSGSTIMSQLDVSNGSTGMRLQVNTEAKLKALLEISRNLGRAIGLTEVLPKLLDSLFKIFIQADRGFIVLLEPQSGRLVPKAIKYRRSEDTQSVKISRTIINSVLKSKQAVLSADAASDERFDMSESIVDFRIRSMMCAPLITGEGNALGVIQIDTLDSRNRFNREDLDVLASVACQAAFAVENAQLHETALRDQAIKRELAVAHEVQRGFLPAESPNLAGYDFFEFYESAHALGGDYYDYVPLSGGRLAVVLGDVSGKGISASLLMAKLSAEARFCLASESTPADAVTKLNRVFCGSGWEDRFVTLVLAVLDPIGHQATIVNAGHMPPLLHQGKDSIQPVGGEISHLPLGVDLQTAYEQSSIPLQPGDSLILYTDGITEAMNAGDELYSRRRLITQLAGDVDSVAILGRRILDDVRTFVGSRQQSDDMCLVCVGRRKEG